MIKRLIKNNLKAQDIAVINIEDGSISCFFYEISNTNKHRLVAKAKSEAEGFDNGYIVDLQKAIRVVANLLDICESSVNRRFSKVIVNAPYSQTKIINYPYADNISRVVDIEDINKSVNYNNYQRLLSNDEVIISLKANQFYLDNKLINNPLGLYAKNFSADVLLVSMFKSHAINMYNLCNYLSLEIIGFIYTPHALSYFYDNLNSINIFIDINYQNTIVSIVKDNIILYSDILAIGVENILLNLANHFKIDYDFFNNNMFFNNYLKEIKGKMIKINYNNNYYEISYAKFYKSLHMELVEFFNQITIMISKYKINLNENITIIGKGCELLSVNEMFVNHLKENIVLNRQLKKESFGLKLDLEDVTTVSLMKYYLDNIKTDTAIEGISLKLQSLNKR